MSLFFSPLMTAVAAVIAAAIGALVVIFVGRRSRRFQTIESTARADLSLDVTLESRVLVVPNGDGTSLVAVLETRVEVKNNSRITGCVPALYLSGRPLIRMDSSRPYVGESDYENLGQCSPVSDVINAAQLARSIYQLAPDEIERFVRWDTLDEIFIRQNPVVVVNAELFGVSADLLGEIRFPKYKKGCFRDDWIEFMRSDNGARHCFVMFDRWQPAAESDDYDIRTGARYLKSPDDPSLPDIENTRRFDKVLESVTQWSRHVTVDLITPVEDMKRRMGHGPTGRLAAKM